MGFLSYLGFGKMVKDGADVLEFPKLKAVEPVKPVEPPTPEPREYYRVGYVSQTKMTTFTIMGDHGYNSTLSMNKTACEQLIRMLRATYEEDEVDPEPTDDPDGGLPVPEEDRKVA